jgi:hypothetical protein
MSPKREMGAYEAISQPAARIARALLLKFFELARQ